MAINPSKIEQIKSSAKVLDILRDQGVEMRPIGGGNYTGLSPFREDRHAGSFVANETKNIVTDFATDEKWNAISLLADLKYGAKTPSEIAPVYVDCLRYLAAMYGIEVDDGPVPKVERRPPREAPKPLTRIIWPLSTTEKYLSNWSSNPLISWLGSLPMEQECKKRLFNMILEYRVGTSVAPGKFGWTVFWMINEKNEVLNAKLMKYEPDGHRSKTPEGKGFVTWMSALFKYDRSQYTVDNCYFGMHLIERYPDAEVCIVESEKTALICSAFVEPEKRIWLASGGLSNINPRKLQPLLERNRYIVLFPDHDGQELWTKKCQDLRGALDYPRLSVSKQVVDNWSVSDGPKADIGDILVRLCHGIEDPVEVQVANRLGVEVLSPHLKELMDNLQLVLDP